MYLYRTRAIPVRPLTHPPPPFHPSPSSSSSPVSGVSYDLSSSVLSVDLPRRGSYLYDPDESRRLLGRRGMASTGTCRSSTCPAWLQSALTDIQQRVQALAAGSPEEAAELPDSFAERAENYYQKRPQLISLLHDLHSRYVYLADRYSRSLNCRHRRDPSAYAPSDDDDNDSDYPVHSVISSDAESSLSFHQLPNAPTTAAIAADSGNGGLEWLVAELVAAEVDRDLLLAELAESERLRTESARKAELQSSLLEVLESERMALLGENARLAYQAAAATEEASGLAAEAVYMRRKAAELARCMLKMREDHRVCLLGRKIEGLQAQIYGLERKNRECYEAMAKRQVEKVETRLEIERLQDENRRLKEAAAARKDRRRRLRSELVARWWAWVKNMEWAPPPCRPGMKAEKNGCVCVAFV